MKKNIQILSLLMLMTSVQTQCVTAIASAAGKNPELNFRLAYATVDKFKNDIMLANDDIVADAELIKMAETIEYNATLQKNYDNAKNNVAVIDIDAIVAENNRLQDGIKNASDSIKRLEAKGFGKDANKKKIRDRRNDRSEKQAQIDRNLALITANQNSMTQAQTAQAGIKTLMEKNALQFEDLLESYILKYGQYYTTSGKLWGENTIISSIYSKDMPITPNKYDKLVAVLKAAIPAFNDNITLEITPDQNLHASISDVLGYIQNLKPTAARTWATFGIQAGLAAAITGAAAVAVASYMGYNLADIPNLFDNANIAATGEQIANLWNSASANASGAVNNAVTSIQSWFNIIPANQQLAVVNTTLQEMENDPALAIAATESLVANNQAIADANPNNAAAQQALAESQALADEIEYQIVNYGKPNFSAAENSQIAPAAAAAGAFLLAAKAGAINAASVELAGKFAPGAGEMISASAISTPEVIAAPTGIFAVLENVGSSLGSGIAAALNAGKNSYSIARAYLETPSGQAAALYGANTGAALGTVGAVAGANNAYDQYFS